MRKTHALTSLILCLASSLAVGQTILPVPSPAYPTIQAAIQAANSGDTVMVSPGTYGEKIDYLGKDIVVRAPGGPKYTTIDAKGTGQTVTFKTNETRKAILTGFTITGGKTTGNGGGICIEGAAPTIQDCVIKGNEADAYGAGLGGTYGSFLLVDCLIENNTLNTPTGLGYASGGGLGFPGTTASSPEIRRCRFVGNTTKTRGGGIFFGYNQHALIEDCVFTGNQTLGTTGNLDGGAAIFVSLNALCIIRNNLIHGNISNSNGGGIKFFNLTGLSVVNNTIANNTGGSIAGFANGGAFGQNVSAIVENCILWGNGPVEFAFTGKDKVSMPPSATVTYSAVKGGYTGTGNIALDPKLLNAASGNLRILSTSPCFDSGNSSAKNLPAKDFEGDPRIMGAKVDMGADECNPGKAFLYADRGTLSLAIGGTINYTLVGGASRAKMIYVILPGLSGTTPGFDIAGLHLPLNLDKFTWILLGGFASTLAGNLDASGNGTGAIKLPAQLPVELVGLTISTAGLVLHQVNYGFVVTTNDDNVTLVK